MPGFDPASTPSSRDGRVRRVPANPAGRLPQQPPSECPSLPSAPGRSACTPFMIWTVISATGRRWAGCTPLTPPSCSWASDIPRAPPSTWPNTACPGRRAAPYQCFIPRGERGSSTSSPTSTWMTVISSLIGAELESVAGRSGYLAGGGPRKGRGRGMQAGAISHGR